MQRLSLSFLAVIAALASGCIVVSPGGGGGGGHPLTEPQVSLGPTNYPGYRIQAGASTSLPSGDIGYLVTANGQGGYRIVWTDTLNSPARFSGTITVDTTFDEAPAQTHGISGQENLVFSAANQISFSSTPGANLDGIDLVANSEPIYLDAFIDGSHFGVNIFFTGASTGGVVNSGLDPVAFTSP